ncbi:hypothetical protein L1987_19559 [Smallanthus sonchifolius]|uniref:Uncharacterized protein n=1 Tax=Smallanthus sonchifolius TaxID=185202 RepID=A0ACB9IPN0_9ASTR|nr:hypothetical protein L1987_19559 [Smallanthus sonchifolius]
MKNSIMIPERATLLGFGALVAITVLLSLKLIRDHLSDWRKPKEQGAIIMIILMAPLYAVDSYVGLFKVLDKETIFVYLDAFKECYEGLVMFMSLVLLDAYLGISIIKTTIPDEFIEREIHHLFPMTLFQPGPVELNHQNLQLRKIWILQFVVIRLVCTAFTVVLQLCDMYPCWLSCTFTIIVFVSISIAGYALFVFNRVFGIELEPHKAVAKFYCVKGLLFFCFCQGLLLRGLVATGIIKSYHFWLDMTHIQHALQNTLVIVETVFFTIFQLSAYFAPTYEVEMPDGDLVPYKEE